jgi:hypothetical protein
MMEIATRVRKFFATSEDSLSPETTSENCGYDLKRRGQTPAQVPLEEEHDSTISSPSLNNDFNTSATQKFTGKSEIITKTITNNNREIPDTNTMERAKSLQKSPETGSSSRKLSGNAGNEDRKSTSGNKVLPDNTVEKEIKKSQKTPEWDESTKEVSGNDGEVKDRTNTEPGTEDQQKNKNHRKEPNITRIETGGDNDEGRLQDDKGQETTIIGQKKPQRKKYKTEVEKLREMQVGFEAKGGRRGRVKLLASEMDNNSESNKTQTNGDGPKTGLVE